MASCGLSKYIEIKLQSTCFYLISLSWSISDGEWMFSGVSSSPLSEWINIMDSFPPTSCVLSDLKRNVLFFFLDIMAFYKQLVYKQLALGWQIAKQLSGLNPLSLSNNINYKLKVTSATKR